MPLTKIVITGNKGGTGKTTIAALLAEYLNHLTKKVEIIQLEKQLTNLQNQDQQQIQIAQIVQLTPRSN